MKLIFSLLVVDDQPSGVQQAILALRDILADEGFDLKKENANISSLEDINNLAKKQGRNYDLVMVDYILGRDEFDGVIAVKHLRKQLPYTEMLFYSGENENLLLKKICDGGVEGIFVSDRYNLIHKLEGLANIIIRKAVDFNHMRGIAMAEVAAMDLHMTKTLELVFHNKCNEQVKKVSKGTICKLLKDVKKDKKYLEKYEQNNLADLINNIRLFTLFNKFETLLKLSKDLPEENQNDLEVLSDYKKEIIEKRNLLAHVKETTGENGKVILRAGKNDEIINDKWMKSFRKSLKQHSEALYKICKAVKDEYKTRNVENDSQES